MSVGVAMSAAPAAAGTPVNSIVLVGCGQGDVRRAGNKILFVAGPHQAANGEFDGFCAASG
jgi:hypothetical protein